MGVSGVIDFRATPIFNCAFTVENNTRHNIRMENLFMTSILKALKAQFTEII